MMQARRSWLAGLAAAALAAMQPAPAAAQDFPASGRTLTIVVPWAPGGGVDVVMRMIEPMLRDELGIPVQVSNTPGGGSQVGLTRCAAARPDGYTVCATSLPSTNVTYADAERNAPYNQASFIPLLTFANDVGSVIVKADSRFRTLQDLLAEARSNPGRLRVGNAGRLTNAHLDMLTAERAAGVRFAPVFFTGGAPAVTALLGGHVDAVFSTPSNYMAQVRSGDVRVLGIMSEQPSPLLPGVPTFRSAGVDALGFSTRTLAVQAGTPPAAVARLRDAVRKVVHVPGFAERLEQIGSEFMYLDAEATGALWTRVDADVRAALAATRQN